MRQIGSQETEAQSRKKSSQIFSIILLALLVFSTLGYAFFSNPDTGSQTQTSTGSEVQQISAGQWAFNFGTSQIILTTSPDEAKNISLIDKPNLADFTQQVVYIDASDVIASTIGNAISPYTARIQQACYGSCTRDLPEHNCNDTMIIWKNSDKQQIYKQDKCYFIDGDKRAVDAFLYSIFGMLK